jgi:hypothetical protein
MILLQKIIDPGLVEPGFLFYTGSKQKQSGKIPLCVSFNRINNVNLNDGKSGNHTITER